VSLLRPNAAKIERRVPGAASPTGEPSYVVTTIATGVPCLIDPVPAASRMGGDLKLEIEGVIYIQTHEGFFDALVPGDLIGHAPGTTVTFNGIPYIVAPNARGAYVDVEAGDRLTDEGGAIYLVLAAATYYEVTPGRQVRLQSGRSWA
jgi:hypothetical protein